jgi:hypothetical protein
MYYRSENAKLGKRKTPASNRKTPAAKKTKTASNRKTPAAKTPASNRKTPAAKTRAANYEYRFDLHQHVLCPFPPHAGTYEGEVYGRVKGTYNVYFFMDNTVRKGVPERELEPAPAAAAWAKRRRKEYVGAKFTDKAGTWHVVGLGNTRNVNKYECRNEKTNRKRYFYVSYVVANVKM